MRVACCVLRHMAKRIAHGAWREVQRIEFCKVGCGGMEGGLRID